MPRRLLLPALLASVLVTLLALPAPSQSDKPAVRLAVLVCFDQMRGDYPSRWQKLFGKDGFRRLQERGAWFTNCHYPYAHTVTAAGHASVATGACPAAHGVIGNDWYDRRAGKPVNCVGSDRHELVGAPPTGGKKDAGVSPGRLLSPTVADALKAATAGKGRVVSLSLKDRSAVLPGGKSPDACYWLHKEGLFVTSTYYRDTPHPWVRAFNDGRAALRWFGTTWDRLHPDLDYEKWSGPDDVKGEGTREFRRTFPHPLPGVPASFKAYSAALANSPFGNDLLLELAKKAIDAEKLGTRDVPDLLCLSFSSNDVVGHCWGPDSQEVLDVTLRSDRVLEELLAHLDARVGKGRYALVVTADHGVCPLPEVARGRGKDAGRIEAKLLRRRAEDYLRAKFPTGPSKAAWLEDAPWPWVYLNSSLMRRLHLRPAEVEKALAGWLAAQKGVQSAYTRTRLVAGVAGDDGVGQMVKRSFYEGRAGDVYVVERPYYLITTYPTGTNHGTPHAYDTHVPLLVYGPGVRPGVRRERVSPLAAAGILARALGIKPPRDAREGVPEGLFVEPSGRGR